MAEEALADLTCPPRRLALPDCPTPTSPALAAHYYPRPEYLANAAREMLRKEPMPVEADVESGIPLDVPDPRFTGPF